MLPRRGIEASCSRPAEIQLLGGLLVLLGIAVATRPADMDLGRIVARVRV
jgi:hypothetical protein